MSKIKKSWLQGSEVAVDKTIANDPSKLGFPGEVKYPQNLNAPVGDVREWEQSSFEDAAAATKKNLGPAGAEFKMKQEWQRIPSDQKIANATLSVGLTKNANPAKSFITVYAKDSSGEKTPVVKASLSQIWGKELSDKNVEKTYSEAYAKAVIAKIRELGFSKVAFLLTGEEGFAKRAGLSSEFVKKANQAVATKTAQMEEMEEAKASEMEDLDAETAGALDAEMETTKGESEVTVDLLSQKLDEVEQAQTKLVENTAPETTANVFVELQDAEKMLNESKEEMGHVAAKLQTKGLTASQKIQLIKIAAEAQNDAVSILEGSDDVLAKAEEAVKAADAAIEAAENLGGGKEEVEVSEEVEMTPAGDEFSELEDEANVESEEHEAGEMKAEGASAKGFVKAFLKNRETERKKALAMGDSEGYEQGKYNVTPDGAEKDGRGLVDVAHPEGGAAVTNLTAGGKPENEGEVFETISEAQDKDMAAVNKMPTGNLSSKAAGKVTVKTAAADKAAADYWAKQLFGQGDETSKQYGKDLSKEYSAAEVSKAAKAASEETEAKVVRAYELAEVASEKGFCDRTASAKSALVKEILAFDDSAFVAFKKMLDKAPVKAAATEEFVRTASAKLPKVGQKETSAEVEGETGFISRLSNLGWSK